MTYNTATLGTHGQQEEREAEIECSWRWCSNKLREAHEKGLLPHDSLLSLLGDAWVLSHSCVHKFKKIPCKRSIAKTVFLPHHRYGTGSSLCKGSCEPICVRYLSMKNEVRLTLWMRMTTYSIRLVFLCELDKSAPVNDDDGDKAHMRTHTLTHMNTSTHAWTNTHTHNGLGCCCSCKAISSTHLLNIAYNTLQPIPFLVLRHKVSPIITLIPGTDGPFGHMKMMQTLNKCIFP